MKLIKSKESIFEWKIKEEISGKTLKDWDKKKAKNDDNNKVKKEFI